jgi:signal transduction histidine kinase
MALFYSRKKIEELVARRTAEACDQIISEMGAELHDDLIQKLSVFRLYIDKIERSCTDPTEVEMIALKMRTDFEHVITVIRNISRRLLPAKMEGDTIANTLEILCQNMEHPGTGHIHFFTSGNPPTLTQHIEMNLFRIVQELIHNAFKHSAAWHVWVRLMCSADRIMLEVEDDGSGFSKIPEYIQRLKKKNNTLKIRSATIGATIEYQQGSKGLIARLTLPLTS